MSFQLIGNVFRRQTPSYITIFITSKCNCRCPFCFYWKAIEETNKNNELTKEELRVLSKNIKNPLVLSLTGGEPYLRVDIFEIVENFLKNSSPMYLSIPTNGSFPDKVKKMIEHVFCIKPDVNFRVNLSLDAIGEEHDNIRQYKGLFSKVEETYNIISPLRTKYRLFIDVNTVLSAYTKDTIKETVNYIYNKFDFDNINFTLVRGDPKDPEAKKVSCKDYQEVSDLVNSLKKNRETRQYSRLSRASSYLKTKYIEQTILENKMIVPCVAGRKLITIKENGDVYPCELLLKKMGSLREFNYNIKRLLKSHKAKNVLKHIKETKCFCTFECAAMANVIFNVSNYSKLFKAFFRPIDYK